MIEPLWCYREERPGCVLALGSFPRSVRISTVQNRMPDYVVLWSDPAGLFLNAIDFCIFACLQEVVINRFGAPARECCVYSQTELFGVLAKKRKEKLH